jgi:hypothetical protein
METKQEQLCECSDENAHKTRAKRTRNTENTGKQAKNKRNKKHAYFPRKTHKNTKNMRFSREKQGFLQNATPTLGGGSWVGSPGDFQRKPHTRACHICDVF